MRLLQPSITAEPPTTMERDAKVPKPSRRYVVEPCRMRTRSNGSLRVSAATCAKVVSSPCPSTDEPTRTVTEPSRSTVTRVLLARAAALHERNGSKAMVAAVDQPTLERLLLRPADLAQHALEGRVIVAGVEVGLALVGHELAGRERQLGLADQVLAAEVHGIEAEITRPCR